MKLREFKPFKDNPLNENKGNPFWNDNKFFLFNSKVKFILTRHMDLNIWDHKFDNFDILKQIKLIQNHNIIISICIVFVGNISLYLSSLDPDKIGEFCKIVVQPSK